MSQVPSVSSMEDLLSSEILPVDTNIEGSTEAKTELEPEHNTSADSIVLLDYSGDDVDDVDDVDDGDGGDDIDDGDDGVDDVIEGWCEGDGRIAASLPKDLACSSTEKKQAVMKSKSDDKDAVMLPGFDDDSIGTGTGTGTGKPAVQQNHTNAFKKQTTNVQNDNSEMQREWSIPKPEGSIGTSKTAVQHDSSRKGLGDSPNSKEKNPKLLQQNPLKAWQERRRQSSKGSIWQGVRRRSPPKFERRKVIADPLSGEDFDDEQYLSQSATFESKTERDPIMDSECVERVESRSKERQIGTLKVEVLSCTGLVKFDRFLKPNITTYLICGDASFATDSIASLSPIWPVRSKRAVEFPLFHAYARLYLGVFNATEKEVDDFAGRAVINVSSLRQNIQYDVTFPLKVSAMVYDKRYRGSIRLRFELQWSDERLAVLSYLPRTLNDLPWIGDHTKSDFVGIPCADSKTLKNVAQTIFGEDLPSKFSRKSFRARTREMGLYKINIQLVVKSTVRDIMLYESPLISLYAFTGWIGMVYYGRIDLVPSFLVSFVIIVFHRNYIAFSKSQEKLEMIYRPLSIGEITSMLLNGQVNAGTQSTNSDPSPILSCADLDGCRRHQEFPFSDMPGPEQNDEVDAKEGKLFKNNFEDLESRLHTATGHVFHHYISRELDRTEPKKTFPEPQAKLINPLAALSASFLEPVMKAIEVYLLTVRGIFNAFSWKDPFLSFWIVVFLAVIIVILAIFPWRMFFYFTGILCVGPQNLLFKSLFATGDVQETSNNKSENDMPENDTSGLVDAKQNSLGLGKKKKEDEDPSFDKTATEEKLNDDSVKPLFKTTHSTKWQKQSKKSQDEQLYEIIVPYKRFDSERFYYWPPNQSPSQRGDNTNIAAGVKDDKRESMKKKDA